MFHYAVATAGVCVVNLSLVRMRLRRQGSFAVFTTVEQEIATAVRAAVRRAECLCSLVTTAPPGSAIAYPPHPPSAAPPAVGRIHTADNNTFEKKVLILEVLPFHFHFFVPVFFYRLKKKLRMARKKQSLTTA